MKRVLVLCLFTAACAAAAIDAGCSAYGEMRLSMPRPLGAGPLAEWVARLDSRMTGACRH